jgi:hypothetical protein
MYCLSIKYLVTIWTKIGNMPALSCSSIMRNQDLGTVDIGKVKRVPRIVEQLYIKNFILLQLYSRYES